MARPSIYSEELAERICDRIAQGDSVRTICEDDDMPADRTVFYWLNKNPAFLQQYEVAIAARTVLMGEELLEIADEEPEFHHHVGWARNRIDARKWLMAHLQPKKYGDRVMLSGADGTGPAKLVVSWDDGGWSNESKSTTVPASSSGPSTPAVSDGPVSSLTEGLARLSLASRNSNEPHYSVDWSDPDLPTSPHTGDKPKP